MNTIISTLNHWGVLLPRLGWALLWQSSLLIAILFAADAFLRRRVQASVRHVLWLVVLVKLVIPPSFALPTSITWWLRRPVEPAAPQTHYIVNYGANTLSEPAITPIAPIAPLPPRPSGNAWLVIGWAAVAMALFGWMLAHWAAYKRRIKSSAAAPDWLVALLLENQRKLGLRGPMQLRLTSEPTSPAVCGLLQPIILLPQSLADSLSRTQLRAVLLHELIHLRRADVWVNCAQTLLQIAYWWHPLLWLANARIRQVREEAVDDAVMLALAGEADAYAPTLLEVAKLAFTRPIASLGLVGILESRNALKRRIERLVSVGVPNKAGLTVASIFGIVAFSALAVPMGDGPTRIAESMTGPSTTAEVQPSITNSPMPTPAPVASSGTNETLTTRVFKVPPDRLAANWTAETNMVGSLNVLRDLIAKAGVDLHPPKAFFYSKHGGLFVRATPKDLDVIESVITALNVEPPQIEIAARFVEVPGELLPPLFAEAGMTNLSDARDWAVALTESQARTLKDRIQHINDAKVLAAPRVSTMSGREARVSIETTQTVVTGLTNQFGSAKIASTNGDVIYLTEPMNFGPVLDVAPNATADGQRISLMLIATVTDFIGYDDPGNFKPRFAPIQGVQPLPLIRTRKMSTSIRVDDGATVMLGGPEDIIESKSPSNSVHSGHPTKTDNRMLLVFVTPTIVDDAGHPVHSSKADPSHWDKSDPQIDDRLARRPIIDPPLR